MIYIYIFNCNWVDTWWQQYSLLIKLPGSRKLFGCVYRADLFYVPSACSVHFHEVNTLEFALIYIFFSYKPSHAFIHLSVSLTTGPKRAVHILQSKPPNESFLSVP
jgi:hypothetical protein